MHFDLKSISTESVPKALEKAERYRLLNEPSLAESICLDILAVSPSHQQALISLLLARTDQFGYGATMKSAEEVLMRIEGAYERAYYTGLVWERQGHAYIRQRGHLSHANSYHALRRAMESEGFTVNEDEWWHFDYKDWKLYPILDVPFEKLAVSNKP